MNKLTIGDRAPDFTATITDGSLINLSDFKGKYVVLYFYPKDNTPGCTIEAKDFNSLKEDFAALDAEIIGVSKDDLKSHENFCNKYGLNFSLISDTNGDLCEKFNVWVQKSIFGKKYMGIERSSFLIDQDGKIAYIWPSVSAIGHAKNVLKKLQELQSKDMASL